MTANGWLDSLAASLTEALPRLHGCPAEESVSRAINALTRALAEGRLELGLDGAEREAVSRSPLATGPESPLLLVDGHLCWRRWHEQRSSVVERLLTHAAAPAPINAAERERGTVVSRHGQGLDPDQRQAVAAVLRHRLVLLEGGPGTGKTSTVSRMLAAVRELRPNCRIQLAAPTGKAATRLRAAIAPSHPDLNCSTLHRLLESRGQRFHRNRQQPLSLDLLVVDELSMVDLHLMEALLDALPLEAQLVLVGDAAQLPPVGTGAVLLDLQHPHQRSRLDTAAVVLRTTYRNQGAVAAVAAWLREQLEEHAAGVEAAISHSALAGRVQRLDGEANLHLHAVQSQRLPRRLLTRLQAHQERLQQLSQADRLVCTTGTAELLAALDQCLVLSPLRRGAWGVDAVHRALLGDAAERGPDHWPLGTPVLCNLNQDELGLANGDVGVLVEHQGQRRLLFAPAGMPKPIWVHPAQLPGISPALALTVHKAQGSEADEVWVLLPELDRPSGRLLYTALTRARVQAHLVMAVPGRMESPEACRESANA